MTYRSSAFSSTAETVVPSVSARSCAASHSASGTRIVRCGVRATSDPRVHGGGERPPTVGEADDQSPVRADLGDALKGRPVEGDVRVRLADVVRDVLASGVVDRDAGPSGLRHALNGTYPGTYSQGGM